MLRASALMMIVASAVVAGLLWWSGDDPVQAVEEPELRSAPEPFAAAGTSASAEAEVRIGEFKRPEEVPEYEILEKREDERDGARGVWLLIDTRSRSQEDYVLITRHLKARYAGLDAVSARFVDRTRTLRYNGGAVIFNTLAGARYIGYFYGPPNARGYYVKAAD